TRTAGIADGSGAWYRCSAGGTVHALGSNSHRFTRLHPSLVRPKGAQRFMSGGPPTAPGTALPEPPGYPAEIPRPPVLQQLHEVMVRCTRCDLFISRTQVVPGAGD